MYFIFLAHIILKALTQRRGPKDSNWRKTQNKAVKSEGSVLQIIF